MSAMSAEKKGGRGGKRPGAGRKPKPKIAVIDVPHPGGGWPFQVHVQWEGRRLADSTLRLAAWQAVAGSDRMSLKHRFNAALAMMKQLEPGSV